MTEERPGQRLGPQQARVYLAIRTAIEQRHLEPGQRLASQAQLAQQHGVALATLHQALGTLEQDGYISRRQGVGTFVADPPPVTTTRLQALAQFTTRQFSSTDETIGAALQLLAEQIGMRSAFLSQFDGDQLAIIADYDHGGCGIRAGARFPLDDAF